jgi:hypothetical protein
LNTVHFTSAMPCGFVRGREADNLSLEMERIAGAHRRHPAQLVDAHPYQGMRTERPDLDGQVHGDRSRMPSGSRETFEWRFRRRGFVQMHRLRIVFRGETFDVAFGDLHASALETHPQRQIVEPLDHRVILFK